MSDPRWTVDDDGWLTFDRNLVMISSWNLDEYHDAQGCIRPDAFDALVAAVHDADTLRQARQLAITYRRTVYGIDRQTIAGQLVDLLAPPDSGEGT